jgi:DNA-binding MarR family transcriptional regulator
VVVPDAAPDAAAAPGGSHTGPGAGTAPIVDLQIALANMLAAQRRLTWRTKRHGGSTTPDRMRALVHLEQGETTHGELVREAQLNRSSVSGLLDDLARQELIERRQDPSDGRVWLISLTPRGRAHARDLRVDWMTHFEAHLGDLDDEEIYAGARLLERLTSVFDSLAAQDSRLRG